MIDNRKLYPITRDGIFLNHAATAPISTRSIERMHRGVAEMCEPLGKHFYQNLGALEDTRRRLAELIGAHSSELAFSSNTSTALSLIAQSVPWREGDRVLVPANEFPSNVYVWQNLARQGVTCTLFDVVPGESLVDTLERQDLSRVRLISISSVSYQTGRRYELERFTEFCRERKILSCFDAIQEIGTQPVDVHKTGVDFLASGAQKWLLGPIGCGFLYARRELLESLNVPYVGWTSVQYPENFSIKALDFATEMTRFEPGLPNLLPVMGLNESLRELEEIGWSNIHAQLQAHTAFLADALLGLQLELLATPGAGIVSFALPARVDVQKLNHALHEANITITQRENYVRVSPHFYTTRDELATFLDLVAYHVGRARSQAAPTPPRLAKTSRGEAPRALLVGATGIVGNEIARQLSALGWHLTLVAKTVAPLEELARSLPNARALPLDLTTDFEPALPMDVKYDALINAAGVVTSEPFLNLTPAQLDEMFRVNVLAPAALMRIFLTRLCTDDAQGILNIVSSSGRCGYPLLAAYGGANGALWTMSEALHREIVATGRHVTTFVAPAMHSRMQKRMGRVALRYFKLSGTFDYELPKDVAAAAITAFLEKKGVVVPRQNRVKLWLNAAAPSVMDKQLAKVWRR